MRSIAIGSAGCSPVGPTCGAYASVGLVGSANDFAQIPWSKLVVFAHWDGN